MDQLMSSGDFHIGITKPDCPSKAIILSLGLLFQLFRQPQLVAYMIAGVVIGPSGIGLVSNIQIIEHLGALDVTLLLFFIGMEVSP